MANPASISFGQLFRYWKNLPHQSAAIDELEKDLKVNGYDAAMRRDRDWFKTWSQDGKQSNLAAAISIIKEFEGTYLTAYRCPAGVWTIGIGTTRYTDGTPVKQGDKITPVEADMMLRMEVDRIAATLGKQVPYWSEMNDNQKSALISFAYNLGEHFYGAAGFTTITSALREKRWDDVPRAMLLYRNPGSSFENGLKRRRIAEGKLWAS